MKLKDWLRKNKGIFSRRDLNYIIAGIVKKSREGLSYDFEVNSDDLRLLEKAVALYKKGIPAAYILGKEDFFSYELFVSPDVLIPRPETEIIIEKALAVISENKIKDILDLGTGSANIALTIAKNTPAVRVIASDISFSALELAKKNICRYGLSNVDLVCGDLFSIFSKEKFGLIISNPPYVEESYLSSSFYLKAEPYKALWAGKDGLLYLRKILTQGRFYLKAKGYLILEFGSSQKEKVVKMAECYYKVLEVIKDYSGNWRGIILQNG